MVLRPLLVFSTLATVLLTLPILAIHSQPIDYRDLSAFLTAPANCAAPCFMGIKPGVTSVGATMNILRAHTWVRDIRVDAYGENAASAFGYAEINWDWSGQHPALIDATQPGRISFLWDRESQNNLGSINAATIETITIQTTIHMDRARLWYGTPDSGQVSERPNQQIAYASGYHFSSPPGMIQLSAQLPCPADWLSYWNARAKIEMTVYLATTATVSPSNLIDAC